MAGAWRVPPRPSGSAPSEAAGGSLGAQSTSLRHADPLPLPRGEGDEQQQRPKASPRQLSGSARAASTQPKPGEGRKAFSDRAPALREGTSAPSSSGCGWALLAAGCASTGHLAKPPSPARWNEFLPISLHQEVLGEQLSTPLQNGTGGGGAPSSRAALQTPALRTRTEKVKCSEHSRDRDTHPVRPGSCQGTGHH